jgi:hypothetical protein
MKWINIASYILNFILMVAVSNAKATINRYEKVMRMLGVR